VLSENIYTFTNVSLLLHENITAIQITLNYELKLSTQQKKQCN